MPELPCCCGLVVQGQDAHVVPAELGAAPLPSSEQIAACLWSGNLEGAVASYKEMVLLGHKPNILIYECGTALHACRS